jgi:hypothetical protein
MKIERFNKINENNSNVVWIFTSYGGVNDYDTYNYVFDNENDAFNFMANKIYNIFQTEFEDSKTSDKENQDKLDEALLILDECDNLDSMIEFLNDCIDDEYFEEYDEKLYIDKTTLDKNIQLDDWIELRRSAKKYNV